MPFINLVPRTFSLAWEKVLGTRLALYRLVFNPLIFILTFLFFCVTETCHLSV